MVTSFVSNFYNYGDDLKIIKKKQPLLLISWPWKETATENTEANKNSKALTQKKQLKNFPKY